MTAPQRYRSWGRYPPSRPAAVHRLASRCEPLPASEHAMLAYGNGRSYGDSCLNNGGALLDVRGLDRFIAFDPAAGRLSCEAGVLLTDILRLVVPRGWFLPVTPGTQQVTVGGAIANDVHGKNHHRSGTFGAHVRELEVRRSDGTRIRCSPQANADWLAATVGGLGLTGVILWATIDLTPIRNPYVDAETIRFPDLDAFFELAEASDRDYDYTVAWIDCLAGGRHLGRGRFSRGNHAPALPEREPGAPGRRSGVPFTPPVSLVNHASLRAFNAIYYRRPLRRHTRGLVHYQPFFYPLDRIAHWNRLYGPRGFLQHQCVVPEPEAVGELLAAIRRSGQGSFLAVLKAFGDRPSPGWLSFPRPGTTLALDFPNRGEATFELLERLDAIVAEAGGAVYPAKDARMRGERFRQAFPAWSRFAEYVDPRFASDLWRRVMGDRS